jgi:site-specific DNA-cytosine methylase
MTRNPIVRAFLGDEVIVDHFCGGGGASSGIELALGRSPDIAVNHDPEAIAMHARESPRDEALPRERLGRRSGEGLRWQACRARVVLA